MDFFTRTVKPSSIAQIKKKLMAFKFTKLQNNDQTHLYNKKENFASISFDYHLISIFNKICIFNSTLICSH